MYLDEVVAAQKRGEARGIPSICSAHPYVIKQTLRVSETPDISPLIEATCNQVNQFGGYTGMTPEDFVAYVRGIAKEANFPLENIILGGDHLGPNVWQGEPAESAMEKSKVLVRDYVKAGFLKIHLDCSMRLADDPLGVLNPEIVAQRAARLAKAAEESLSQGSRGEGGLRYVIGTEVPIPGGAKEHEEGVRVTTVEDARQTIEVTREAFVREGLESAWERVIAVVVQPGVEFGDDFVLEYQPEKAKGLSRFIEGQSMIYEAHSTDYQTRDALTNLVRDHFAILKVGPALTFAFREAVFALAMIENELISKDGRSNLIQVLEDVMLVQPEHWQKYYHGTQPEQAFKRKYSLSDRARYYWVQPEVQHAFTQLMHNLGDGVLPYSLLSQFVNETHLNAAQVIDLKINKVLNDYMAACKGRPPVPSKTSAFE
jgi:D-tagatose-1,6-bisphosphate aldolase subunit GatZ/KbaZ